jgi:hypothetical protein
MQAKLREIRLMRFIARLGLGALLLAIAVALNLVPALQQTGITQAVVRSIILALILFGLWRGLAATSMPTKLRDIRWLSVAIVLLVWQAIAWALAVAGAFQPDSQVAFLLPAAILLPLLVGLPFLLRSAWLGQVLDVTPPEWLVGLQVYRVFGSIWILAWLAGALPGTFALPAGIGDTLVGLLALPVAGMLGRNRAAGVAWNILGLLDLADALALGFLTSPVGAYPLVLIPAFVVPLSILLHSVSLRQLRRLARRAGDTTTLTSASPAAVQYAPATLAN